MCNGCNGLKFKVTKKGNVKTRCCILGIDGPTVTKEEFEKGISIGVYCILEHLGESKPSNVDEYVMGCTDEFND